MAIACCAFERSIAPAARQCGAKAEIVRAKRDEVRHILHAQRTGQACEQPASARPRNKIAELRKREMTGQRSGTFIRRVEHDAVKAGGGELVDEGQR